MSAKFGFHLVDIFAVSFFFVAWFGQFWLVNYSSLRNRTITYHMNFFRHQWMRHMVRRDARMVDALIQNSLQQGVLFFASTSILLVGALVAGLGASDQAIGLLNDLPLATETTKSQWEVKTLLVAFIFVFAFFKFAWSHRLFNYVLIMLGATPEHDTDETALTLYAAKVAELHALGARHFTIGLNAYFFALAAIVWFLNPWLFIVATLWVSLVLYRRAFHSKFAKILSDA